MDFFVVVIKVSKIVRRLYLLILYPALMPSNDRGITVLEEWWHSTKTERKSIKISNPVSTLSILRQSCGFKLRYVKETQNTIEKLKYTTTSSTFIY